MLMSNPGSLSRRNLIDLFDNSNLITAADLHRYMFKRPISLCVSLIWSGVQTVSAIVFIISFLGRA